MDTSSEYPSTPTINMYNIHLQQQQQHHHHQQIRHQSHLQQYPQQHQQQQQHQHQQQHQQHQQHQQQFCDPTTSSTSEMMWENHQKKHGSKASYILSPPEDDEYAYRQHYQPSPQMYYDKSPANEFFQGSTNVLKTEDESSLFIDSSIHRQPIMTMHTREDNTSQSSSNNTAPSTCSTITDKKIDGKKQCAKDVKKSSTMIHNKPAVVVEKKRYRRESHNAVERRRRNNINDNIKSLGQLLPENMREGKLNKGSILKGSVVYIHMLNEQLSKYKERLESLQYEAANITSTTTTTTTASI